MRCCTVYYCHIMGYFFLFFNLVKIDLVFPLCKAGEQTLEKVEIEAVKAKIS